MDIINVARKTRAVFGGYIRIMLPDFRNILSRSRLFFQFKQLGVLDKGAKSTHDGDNQTLHSFQKTKAYEVTVKNGVEWANGVVVPLGAPASLVVLKCRDI